MKILQNMHELFKNLKHRGPTKIYCPRCGSPKIRLSGSLDYWLTPKRYVCENCGYIGPVVMELEKEDKKS
ncbi:zinc ribbon domain-containing protein [Candidatus Bathyarchaeota archaeon]|nr:zinc ribbon domain-containing protein [Candidatus Bathyarchaeota archaeon]